MNAVLDAGRARSGSVALPEIDAARAQEYALIARLIARAPEAELIARLAAIEGDATELGQAHAGLAAAARAAEPKAVEREHFTLFVGVGRGEILPYASYYLTGFLNERPLAEVRRDLARLGLGRAERVHEPEDGLALLCDVMATLAGTAAPGEERRFFGRHLAPWAGQCFGDIATAPSADFYRAVGTLGATFMAIEARAFAMEG